MNEERDDSAFFFPLPLTNKMGLHYWAEEGTPSVINYMKEQQAKLERGWSHRLTLWPLAAEGGRPLYCCGTEISLYSLFILMFSTYYTPSVHTAVCRFASKRHSG